jgi:hypothetical protein
MQEIILWIVVFELLDYAKKNPWDEELSKVFKFLKIALRTVLIFLVFHIIIYCHIVVSELSCVIQHVNSIQIAQDNSGTTICQVVRIKRKRQYLYNSKRQLNPRWRRKCFFHIKIYENEIGHATNQSIGNFV